MKLTNKIIVRDDLDSITDEQFEALNEKFTTSFEKHFKDNNILENYISYYIAERIKHNFLFSENLDTIIFSALEDLSQFTFANCDINKIKDILKIEYNYNIIQENPIKIIDWEESK